MNTDPSITPAPSPPSGTPELAVLNPTGAQETGENLPRRGKRRPDLATLTDVRRELGRVYRDMRVGKIKTSDGTRLAYVLSCVGKLIETSELLSRIEVLEATRSGRGRLS